MCKPPLPELPPVSDSAPDKNSAPDPDSAPDENSALDEQYMQLAIDLAGYAAARGEVPIGAVVVRDGAVIGMGWNCRESEQRATGHAEIMAIERACAHLRSWRLERCDLYVTLEPCPMCAGVIQQSRIRRLIFGTADPKAGAVCSKWQILDTPDLNHRVIWQSGVRGEVCRAQLQTFFRELRRQNKSDEQQLGGRGARRRAAKGETAGKSDASAAAGKSGASVQK